VVANAYALSPTGVLEPSLQSDVGESSVAIVLKKMIERLLPGRKTVEARAVHQENVEPAIVVVVVERNAAAGGLEQIPVLVLTAEDGNGVQARFFRHIDKADAEVGAGRSGSGFLGKNRQRPGERKDVRKREHQSRAAKRL